MRNVLRDRPIAFIVTIVGRHISRQRIGKHMNLQIISRENIRSRPRIWNLILRLSIEDLVRANHPSIKHWTMRRRNCLNSLTTSSGAPLANEALCICSVTKKNTALILPSPASPNANHSTALQIRTQSAPSQNKVSNTRRSTTCSKQPRKNLQK